MCGNIKKCPFTYWLNGRWFLQIVDIGNSFPQIVDIGTVGIYIQYIYIQKTVVLASELVGGRSRATELPCILCHGDSGKAAVATQALQFTTSVASYLHQLYYMYIL